ncbi:MAG: hypothetical protein PHC96_02945 [Firmicutes bacterium]|nr:hypothetical protein [Bacillota bacterium]
MKKGKVLVLMLLFVCLGLLVQAAKVEFKNMDDWGEVVGNGSWEDFKGAWIAGTATENWLGSLNTYENFILEFDLTINGRTLVIVRSPIRDIPFYYGAGIDLVSLTDVRLRRWEDGGWAPAYQHYAEIYTPYYYGETLHFKVTVQKAIATFEITNEYGDLIIEDEVDVGEFMDPGYIWLRSTSPGAESVLENLTIEEI